MRKRLFTFILVLSMILCVLPMCALAEESTEYSGTCGDNATWTLDSDGVLTISGSGTIKNYYTPEYYYFDPSAYNDTRSAPWYKLRDSVLTVQISDGITYIGHSAFDSCSNLTNISIPDSVTSICGWAFKDCNSLTNVMIPNGVTYIGNSAFENCSSLTNMTIPNGVTYIGASAFENCSSLTNMTIPDGVTRIFGDTFSHCSNLTSITIPDSVTSIGIFAFEGCFSLTKITIPDSVIDIEHYAFYYCSNLTSVTIPDSVTSIGFGAFCGCSGLKKVTILGSMTAIKNYAFDNCNANLTINSYDGSYAENYANKTNTNFKSLGSMKLSYTSVTYTGQTKKPSVKVFDSKGKLISSKYYTVSYASGRKNIGKYKVMVKFKGIYSGNIFLYFKIIPKGTSLKSLTASSKAFSVEWTKQATQTTGYQIQYSTNSKFKSAKTVTVSGSKTISKKISKLSSKKKYYVRIRTYKTVNKVNYYSGWSKTKYVTTK